MARIRIFLLVAAVLGAAAAARGGDLVYSLVLPVDPVAGREGVRADLVLLNPGDETVEYDLPVAEAGRLAAGDQAWPVELHRAGGGYGRVPPGGFAHVPYNLELPAGAAGRLVLELERPARLRGVIDVDPKAAAVAGATARSGVAKTPLANVIATRPASVAVKRAFVGRFSPHEPVYFVYGAEAPAAKFQFSFKYRLLGDDAALGDRIPALRGLYFGYTQRSLWDLDADSSPFYDTSYMPELIFESQSLVDPGSPGGGKWLGYQLALKHESNGRDGLSSRSLNTVYARTAFSFGRLDGWNLLVIPRVFAYVSDLGNNPDIAQYRGNADLVIVVGRNDGVALSLTGQAGRGLRHGSLQADLSIPVKFDRLFDFATYFLVQYWDGYGEDLLQYNQRTTSLRFGFSLVR